MMHVASEYWVQYCMLVTKEGPIYQNKTKQISGLASKNLAFFIKYYIWFSRKLSKTPLAPLAVLLAPGYWTVGYVEPCIVFACSALNSPWTYWLPFRRQYFQTHFHEWKVLYFDSNFTEICSLVSNWQEVSIGSGNGVAPSRWQAITWTNADQVHQRIYATLGGDEVRRVAVVINHIGDNQPWLKNE